MDNIIEAEFREVSALEEKGTEVLTAEANAYYQQAESLAQASMLSLAEAGRRLNIIKEREGHGNWEEWMKSNLLFSPKKANRIMKLAKNIDENIGIFSNPSTLTDIGISKVWALLGAPEEVQKEVVENPEMQLASVKEFEEEIKRLKKELENKDEQNSIISQHLEEEREKKREWEGKSLSIQKKLEEAQEQSSEQLTAEKKKNALIQEEKERIEKALEQAKEDAKRIPETVIDEEAITKAVEEAKKEVEKELQEYKQKAEAHSQTLEDENKNLAAALEKSKKESDSTLLIFDEKYKTFQSSLAGVLVFVEKDTDSERKQKMKNAMKLALSKVVKSI